MRLITETVENVKTLVEGSGDSKSYFIKGIFAQAEKKNRNGRLYPKHIMEREVFNYNKNYIKENMSLGELGHPNSPTVNLDRASHIIKELYPVGNDFMGKAKLMDTPCGKIAKNLIDEGVKLGVSTRGLGSLKEENGYQLVGEDFSLATIDIVSSPSGPDCYVNGIYEGVEWIFDPKYGWKSMQIAEQHKKFINKNKIDETKALKLFNQFLGTLK